MSLLIVYYLVLACISFLVASDEKKSIQEENAPSYIRIKATLQALIIQQLTPGNNRFTHTVLKYLPSPFLAW